jgi:mannose-1-phosphate guanylyltransferase
MIVEPGRRGTASCITLALAHIAQTYPADEMVVFLHADHHIVDQAGFVASVRAAASASVRQEAIALIGLKPTYPSTGFGYIHAGAELPPQEGLPVHMVTSFKEKPNYETAERYVAEGTYFWNLGLFAGKLDLFVKEYAQVAPDLHAAYEALSAHLQAGTDATETYLALPTQQIDVALIERTPRLVMIPGSFDWADLGSFFDLHNVLRGQDGNTLKGDISMIDCEDSMIHGTTKPIIAIGLSGIVVVDTPEGLLVCRKEDSMRVGELSKLLQQRDRSTT